MPVAPTYQKFEVLNGPYLKNKRQYVIINYKDREKEVRWYSDNEYRKLYPSTVEVKDYGGLKAARGFSKGPIWLVTNSKPEDEWWLKKAIARYAVDTGWYIVSTDSIPADAPSHLVFKPLSWEEYQESRSTDKLAKN